MRSNAGPRKPVQFHGAGAAGSLQRPIDKPEAPLGNPFTHVQIRRDVANIIMKRACSGSVQTFVVVTTPFQFTKESALKPALRVGIVISDNVAYTHQDAAKVSQNGIKGTARIVRCCVPITADKRGQLRRQRLE